MQDQNQGHMLPHATILCKVGKTMYTVVVRATSCQVDRAVSGAGGGH